MKHRLCGRCDHPWDVHQHMTRSTRCGQPLDTSTPPAHRVHFCSCPAFRSVLVQRLLDRVEGYARGVFYTACAVLLFGAASITDIRL